jgi:hypothetical protein
MSINQGPFIREGGGATHPEDRGGDKRQEDSSQQERIKHISPREDIPLPGLSKDNLGQEIMDTLAILRDRGNLCANEEEGLAKFRKERRLTYFLWPDPEQPSHYHILNRLRGEVITKDIHELPKYLKEHRPQMVRKFGEELELTKAEKIETSLKLLSALGILCRDQQEANRKFQINRGLPFFIFPWDTQPKTFIILRPSTSPKLLKEDSVIRLAKECTVLFELDKDDSIDRLRGRGCLCRSAEEAEEKLKSNPGLPFCVWPSQSYPGYFGILEKDGNKTKILIKYLEDLIKFL